MVRGEIRSARRFDVVVRLSAANNRPGQHGQTATVSRVGRQRKEVRDGGNAFAAVRGGDAEDRGAEATGVPWFRLSDVGGRDCYSGNVVQVADEPHEDQGEAAEEPKRRHVHVGRVLQRLQRNLQQSSAGTATA